MSRLQPSLSFHPFPLLLEGHRARMRGSWFAHWACAFMTRWSNEGAGPSGRRWPPRRKGKDACCFVLISSSVLYFLVRFITTPALCVHRWVSYLSLLELLENFIYLLLLLLFKNPLGNIFSSINRYGVSAGGWVCCLFDCHLLVTWHRLHRRTEIRN